MYFFYFDESGSRDPSVGTTANPKNHLYVLLAVGMYEGQWRPFDSEISLLKLELAHFLKRDGKGDFELADCEVKSNWVRIPAERAKRSPFLDGLHPKDLTRLAEAYYGQVIERKTVIMATVIDKRYLRDYMNHEQLHKKAYEPSIGADTALHEGISREAPSVDRDGRHKYATQPCRRDETRLLPAGRQPKHGVPVDCRVPFLYAQRTLQRRSTCRPASLRCVSRVQGRKLRVSLFQETTAEFLLAKEWVGSCRTESLAKRFAVGWFGYGQYGNVNR